MTWQQLSVICQADQLVLVEDLMLELGALSISFRDAGDEPIYEPLPGDNPVWSESVVTATFAADSDPEALQQRLAASLPPRLAQSVSRDSFQDCDWEQAYRQHFSPIQCAPKLWIVPTWLEPPDPDATNIRLDPGLAFGTGGHPTTALCLEWLASKALQGQQLIDFGCGSGILAIAAIKLGANRVSAVDIDPQALDACQSNMAINSISKTSIQRYLPNEVGTDTCDLLIANILAGPLLELRDQFARLVRPGGYILLSGILVSQLPEVQSVYSEIFAMQPARQHDGWACIAGQRPEQEHNV
jgi:ribosomal protein L11 methyltransferase